MISNAVNSDGVATGLPAVGTPGVDDATLSRAAAGDPSAWQQIVDRFAGLVWSVARRHDLTGPAAATVSRLTWRRLHDRLDVMSAEGLAGWLAETTERESVREARLLAAVGGAGRLSAV